MPMTIGLPTVIGYRSPASAGGSVSSAGGVVAVVDDEESPSFGCSFFGREQLIADESNLEAIGRPGRDVDRALAAEELGERL